MEYAVANKIVSQSVFQWWVQYTLKNQDRIIKLRKKQIFRKKVEKFEIEALSQTKPALKLIQRAEWIIGLSQETGQVNPALKVPEDGEWCPVSLQQIDITIKFYSKTDLTCKYKCALKGTKQKLYHC